MSATSTERPSAPTGRKATGSFEKQLPGQGKSTPSANPLKRGPESSDFQDISESEADLRSPIDGHPGEVPSAVLHTDGEAESKGDNNIGGNVSRTTTIGPKLFSRDKDNPNRLLASQKSKPQGKPHVEHRQKSSKDFKKQASSDVGGRGTRPWEGATPKRILQNNFRIANSGALPDSPPGQARYDSSRDDEAMADDAIDEPEPNTEMLRQPEIRPISHDQLVIEVKGIYAGLVMVEAKCIDVDDKQSLSTHVLTNEQWQSLIALHKQLLHEHHDFFLASQHPTANSNLSKLAAKYSMPARMWRHGIHAFLEVLRHRLPESLEHMLAFIYIAYSMIALLYETVSTFEDTWIECLGDLGRYRMAIEDDEPKDREVWSGVARFWYSKAADKNPTVGRLYHHLAILARPYTLEQLSFYTRSLTCVTPFESARGSIMTLFNPILNGKESSYHKSSSVEQLVIKAHGLLFLYPKKPLQELNDILDELKNRKNRLIEDFVEKSGARFKRIGVFLAVSNIAALLEYGALTVKGTHRSILRREFDLAKDQANEIANTSEPTPTTLNSQDPKLEDSNLQSTTFLTHDEIETSTIVLSHASDLTFSIFEHALNVTDWERTHILPMVHVMLAFIRSISTIPNAIKLFENTIPWAALCSYLNKLKIDESCRDMIWDGETFPSATNTTGRPPPDDYIIRGQVYTQHLFPQTWFTDAKVDDEERMLEQSSHDSYRTIRVLWLAARICSAKQWISYDDEKRTFIVAEYAAKNLTSTKGAAKPSPKLKNLDDVESKDEVKDYRANNQDTMSDVAAVETPTKEVMDISDFPYRPTSTTVTSTVHLDNANITTATSVRQAGFTTPKANDLEEPEDTPMIDISPEKEPTSVEYAKSAKVEDSSRIDRADRAMKTSGIASPRKAIAEFVSDPNAVRIVEAEDNLEEHDS